MEYLPPPKPASNKRGRLSFASDNNAGCMPVVMEAVMKCNLEEDASPAYGTDRYTKDMVKHIRRVFEHESLQCYPVTTGTAANCLALTQLLNGTIGAVCCTDMAHIVTDECGAPEYFTGGMVIRPVKATPHGKITPEMLVNHVHSIPDTIHRSPPKVLSITNCTEVGTVYTVDEVKNLCDYAHMLGLSVHMDGARLANAVATLGCSAADVTWRAGVDALSLGLTKAGAMMSEVIIFFDKQKSVGFAHRHKRAAQLVSKCRFMSVQTTALLRNDMWILGARHANRMATILADTLSNHYSFELVYPCQANELFVIMPDFVTEHLNDYGVGFYSYPIEAHEGALKRAANEYENCQVVRLLTHFATHKEDIDEFLKHVAASLEPQTPVVTKVAMATADDSSVASTPSIDVNPISP